MSNLTNTLLNRPDLYKSVIDTRVPKALKKTEKKKDNEITDEKKQGNKDVTPIDQKGEYSPFAGPSRDEYNEQRKINKALPEFGSYEYFVNREKEVGAQLDDIINKSKPVKNAHRYAGSSRYGQSKKVDKSYSDAVAQDYKNILEALEGFNKGVNYDSNGNVDVKSGIRESEEISGKYVKLSKLYTLLGKDNPHTLKGYVTDKYSRNISSAMLHNSLAKDKIDAYTYYDENKDNVYNNGIGGRIKGNYRIGHINENIGKSGYTAYQLNTDDTEAAEVYDLLQKKLLENNAATFENKNEFENFISVVSSYVPQYINQTKAQLKGGGMGFLAGLILCNPVLGANIGSAVESAGYMFRQTAGMKYVQLLKETDLSLTDAKELATNTAFSSAAIEFSLELALGAFWKGGGALYKLSGGSKKAVVASAKNFFVKKGYSKKLVDTVFNIAGKVSAFICDSVVEGSEEFLQSGMDFVADRYAREGKTASAFQIFTEAFIFEKYSDDEIKHMWDDFKAALFLSPFSAGRRILNNKIVELKNKTLSTTSDSIQNEAPVNQANVSETASGDAINKNRNIDSVPNDSEIPQMYVRDVENNYAPDNSVPQNAVAVKPSDKPANPDSGSDVLPKTEIDLLSEYIERLPVATYNSLRKLSGFDYSRDVAYDVDLAISRITDGSANYSDLEFFKPENVANRQAFYKTTGIKLPDNLHGTVLQLMQLNEKTAIHKDFPSYFFSKYFGKNSSGVDVSLSEVYNEYISSIKSADTLSNASEHIKTRNQKLEGKRHPVTSIPFVRKILEINNRTYEVVVPEFESLFDAKIGEELYFKTNYIQFKECNRQLLQAIIANHKLAESFTEAQLKKIYKGKKPSGYTWHHDAQKGKLQLVDKEVHKKTGHTGGRWLWGGGSEYR